MNGCHWFRHLTTSAPALLLAITLPAASAANELGAGARPATFLIHDADETLRDYCHWQDGVLWLTLPGGSSWELVTSTADNAITNPGDGAFHPYDAGEVRLTLDAVRYPVRRVSAEVFILPYPRRLGLDSAAGPGLILLSPGVRPIPVEQQHAEFVHELGHVVQYALLPDSDSVRWDAYRRLRGIGDTRIYFAGAAHHDRPHEIFAEDFRALFGDAKATYSGTIENSEIAYPTQVTGLSQMLEDLADAPRVVTPLAVVAGDARGNVQLARGGEGSPLLDVFDVSGRRLATLTPTMGSYGATWLWDGRDASGNAVAAGVVFARARDGRGGAARITRLP